MKYQNEKNTNSFNWLNCLKFFIFSVIFLFLIYIIASKIFPEIHEIYQPPLDRWTIMHFAFCLFLGFLVDSISLGLSVIFSWEILEVFTKTEEWITSMPNNAIDMVIGFFGYIIGRHFPKRNYCTIVNTIILLLREIHEMIKKIVIRIAYK